MTLDEFLAMTLDEFLMSRIAEDEAVAAAAASRRDGIDSWEAVGSGTVVGPGCDKVKHVMLPSSEDGAARHIARHDPARVLAECEAKRRIVDLHAPSSQGAHCCTDPEGPAYGEVMHYGGAPCLTLSLLALPYADHPDYRQEWRP